MPNDALPFGKGVKPEYLEVQERRPLSKWEFATLYLKQQGKCASCGERLEKGKVRDEHLHALHLGGGNELTNRALWCLDCTKPKDAEDKARIAKGKRIRGETGTGPKRKIVTRNTFQKPLLPTSDSRKPDGAACFGVSALSKNSKGYRKRPWPKRGFSSGSIRSKAGQS